MEDIRVRLSVLWLFATLNYIYADVFFCIDVLGSRGQQAQTLTESPTPFRVGSYWGRPACRDWPQKSSCIDSHFRNIPG